MHAIYYYQYQLNSSKKYAVYVLVPTMKRYWKRLVFNMFQGYGNVLELISSHI